MKNLKFLTVIALIAAIIFASCGDPEEETPEEQTPVVSLITMVQLAGGTFQMGSTTTTDSNRFDDETQHSVTLSGFSIGKYEVTQEQYLEVMGSNPSSFTTGASEGEVQGKRPVDSVSWYDAIVFCNKLSITEKLDPVYTISGSTNPADWGAVPTTKNTTWDAVSMDKSKNGYRLPTEAEWEYACRATKTTAFNNGAGVNDNTEIAKVAWYTGNSASKTHEVGKKDSNDWQLFDMHGNVFEWCWDWFSDTMAATAVSNPEGPTTGTKSRVMRGGSWSHEVRYLRSALRFDITTLTTGSFDHSGKKNYVGFRVARSGS